MWPSMAARRLKKCSKIRSNQITFPGTLIIHSYAGNDQCGPTLITGELNGTNARKRA